MAENFDVIGSNPFSPPSPAHAYPLFLVRYLHVQSRMRTFMAYIDDYSLMMTDDLAQCADCYGNK